MTSSPRVGVRGSHACLLHQKSTTGTKRHATRSNRFLLRLANVFFLQLLTSQIIVLACPCLLGRRSFSSIPVKVSLNVVGSITLLLYTKLFLADTFWHPAKFKRFCHHSSAFFQGKGVGIRLVHSILRGIAQLGRSFTVQQHVSNATHTHVVFGSPRSEILNVSSATKSVCKEHRGNWGVVGTRDLSVSKCQILSPSKSSKWRRRRR